MAMAVHILGIGRDAAAADTLYTGALPVTALLQLPSFSGIQLIKRNSRNL